MSAHKKARDDDVCNSYIDHIGVINRSHSKPHQGRYKYNLNEFFYDRGHGSKLLATVTNEYSGLNSNSSSQWDTLSTIILSKNNYKDIFRSTRNFPHEIMR